MHECGMDTQVSISLTLANYFSSNVFIFGGVGWLVGFGGFFSLKPLCLLTFSLLYFFYFPREKYIAPSRVFQWKDCIGA